MKDIKLSVWGDSLMQGVIYDSNAEKYVMNGGIVQKVAKTIDIEIKNYSRFGLTTTKAIGIYNKIIKEDISDAILFEFGGNDCNYDWEFVANNPGNEFIPKTPLMEFTKNLENMIDTAISLNKKVLLTTLPPLNSDAFFNFITRNGINKDNVMLFLGDVGHIYRHHERYNNAVVMLAKKYNLPLIDLRDAFLQQTDSRNLMCADGMHPSEEGQKVMYNTFISFYNDNYSN